MDKVSMKAPKEVKTRILENSSLQEWLDECRSSNTRRTYETLIVCFFGWYNKPVEEFVALDQKAKRHLALKFQNEREGANPNSLNAVLTALNSFLEYLDMPINFKGKRVRPISDLTSHTFSNGDLGKMFDAGDTKERALLSLAASLGWEVSAILELDREFLKRQIARAKSEEKQFIYFESVRKKTGAKRFGVLNPLALEWLEKWLHESEGKTPRKRSGRVAIVSNVFDVTDEGVNKTIRTLARKAKIVLTGPRVHFHRIRGWVMSGLSRSGFNEFQIKYLMGKSIPMSDETYLQTLKQEVEERYPVAYERNLCLKPTVPIKTVTDLQENHKALEDEVKALREENEKLRQKQEPFEQLKKDFDDMKDVLAPFLERLKNEQHEQDLVEEYEAENKAKAEITKQLEKEGYFEKALANAKKSKAAKETENKK